MPTSNFDIYEVGDRYLAVTNDVRRRILDTLEGGEKQLADIVEATDRSKANLSSNHMATLLEQGLVTEHPHPEDSRRKLFRLAGRKIGSSTVSLDQLREAVKEYVTVAPQAARFPLSIMFDALAAAPEDIPLVALRRQAHRLGTLVGRVLDAGDGRGLLMEIADLVEREGLAAPVRLEMDEGDVLVLERGEGAPREASVERLGALIGGFVEGVLAGQGRTAAAVEVRVDGDTDAEGEFALSVTDG